jgi:fatty acid CoA ligase FadD36
MPVVPVHADVGVAERVHILTDSGAQAWPGSGPTIRAGCRISRCG